MKFIFFSRTSIRIKIVLLLWASFAVLVFALTSLAFVHFKKKLEQEFWARNARVLGQIDSTMRELEGTVDRINLSAIEYFHQQVELRGMLDTEELKKLARKMGVTHFYATDRNGKFIRTTDTTIGEIGEQGLFDFCDEYRSLITDPGSIQKTPILTSHPYGTAFKFLMRASHDGKYILEAGMHLTFISSILEATLKNELSIQRVGIYTPSGQMLGEINRDPSIKPGPSISLPSSPEDIERDADGNFVIFRRVAAATQNCCECKVKNITVGGGDEYYYWISATADPSALYASIAQSRNQIIVLGASVFLFFVMIGWGLGDRIARRFISLENQIGVVTSTRDFSKRIKLDGRDEIAKTAGDVNALLATVEQASREALEAAEHKNVATVARRIAHDLRSPIAALSAAVRMKSLSPETRDQFVVESLDRISAMATGLARGELGGAKLYQKSSTVSDAVCRVYETKKLEFADRAVHWELQVPAGLQDQLLPGTGDEWFRVISNLVNNAFESVEGGIEPRIALTMAIDAKRAVIELSDNGKGMDASVVAKLGQEGFSFGKQNSSTSGAGVGVASIKALLQKWGGTLTYRSTPGRGTTAIISVPLAEQPAAGANEVQHPPIS